MLKSFTNSDGSIAVTYSEDAPAKPSQPNRAGDVEINGETVSRAELDAVIASEAARPLPELDIYQPTEERFSVEMGGDPTSHQRDQLLKQSNHWLAKAMQESSDYDETTGAFIPKNPNDRDSVNRLRVAVLNLWQCRSEFEYLSGQSQRERAAAAQSKVQLSAHDQAMLAKAEQSGSHVWVK
jgi:hypothetical protein